MGLEELASEQLRIKYAPGVEEEMKRASKDVSYIMDHFTLNEQVDITFVPDFVSFLAWAWAKRVYDYCRHNKVRDRREDNRWLNKLHEEYEQYLIKEWGYQHYRESTKALDKFQLETQQDFTILWFSVNNELKRLYRTFPHENMVTDANIVLILIDYLRIHVHETKMMICDRLGKYTDLHMNIYCEGLKKMMELYGGPWLIQDYNEHLKLWVKIFKNHINGITLEID